MSNINYMQVIPCRQCGGTMSHLNSTKVSMTVSKSSVACGHCNKVNTEERNLYFCTLQCFNDWIKANPELTWDKAEVPITMYTVCP
jgi:transcription elongation factor Elf1